MASSIETYLARNYAVSLTPISPEDGGGWLATIPSLKGCMSDGETKEEALNNLEDAKREWIEFAVEKGLTIPEDGNNTDAYSGKFLVRVSKWLHRELADGAKSDGVSLNQYVATLLAYALAATKKGKSNNSEKKEASSTKCDCSLYKLYKEYSSFDAPMKKGYTALELKEVSASLEDETLIKTLRKSGRMPING